jgi:hypothetical protein
MKPPHFPRGHCQDRSAQRLRYPLSPFQLSSLCYGLTPAVFLAVVKRADWPPLVNGLIWQIMTLDLTAEETDTLARLLSKTIEDDRDPLSPRIQRLRGARALAAAEGLRAAVERQVSETRLGEIRPPARQ